MNPKPKFRGMMKIKKWCINKKFSCLTRGDKIEHNEQDEKFVNSRIADKS